MDIDSINKQITAFIKIKKLYSILNKEDVKDFRQEVFLYAVENKLDNVDFKIIMKVYHDFIRRIIYIRDHELSLEELLENGDDEI